MQTNAMAPRLHRSATDRVVAGVCGGLAESFEVEPSIVRLAFIVATLWGGIGLLAYLVLMVVLPLDADAPRPLLHRTDRSRTVAGAILIVLGTALLAGNFGLAPWLTWSLFWPALLIVIGAMLLFRNSEVKT